MTTLARTLLLLSLFYGMAALPAAAQNAPATEAAPSADELQNLIRRDTQLGQGAEAVAGKSVEVHYTGWLYDPAAPNLRGKKFDSTWDRGKSFSFPLGGGRVIKGWDQGVAGMREGGKRTLIIPGYLGYGGRGAGNGLIPPDAILVFDVELLKVN